MTPRPPMRGPLLLLAVLFGAAAPYPQSRTLDAVGPVRLDFVGGAARGDLRLLALGEAPRHLVALHVLAPGASIACVAAPSDAVGPTRGVNVGVYVKSVAVLMDARWHAIDAARALAGTTFDNWENCGEKPEGRPSPVSRLMPGPDGGSIEDVFDGNPGANLDTVRRTWSHDDVRAMLGTGLAAAGLTMRLEAFGNGADQIVLMRGDPAGFIAAYVPRPP